MNLGITIDDMRERLREIDQRIDRLTIERDLVQDWIKKAHALQDTQRPAAPSGNHKTAGRVNGGKVAHGEGATGVIRELVNREPGLTAAVIADRLSGKVRTSSPNPRRMVVNTLDTLRRRGHLRKDQDGRFYPADA